MVDAWNVSWVSPHLHTSEENDINFIVMRYFDPQIGHHVHERFTGCGTYGKICGAERPSLEEVASGFFCHLKNHLLVGIQENHLLVGM